jgi:hypothetical protein
MAKYKLSEFESMAELPERVVRHFTSSRLTEKTRLQRRLAQVPKWTRRVAVLSDPLPETVIAERFKTLMATCIEEGLSFPKTKAPYTNTFASCCNTVYTKDKVKIKTLSSEVTTYPDGAVCIDVYKLAPPDPKDINSYYWYRPQVKDKVIRIYVSDTVRVTNNVLRALVTGV